MGMEKASMAHVAAAANISKALLYHYYPSKNALIFRIAHSHLTELDEALKACDTPTAKPEERLFILIREILEQYRDASDKHKVLLYGTKSLPKKQMDELRDIERRIVRRLSKLIGLINPSLDGSKSVLLPITMSLFGTLNWVNTWFRPDGSLTREQYADLVAQLFLDGVRKVR